MAKVATVKLGWTPSVSTDVAKQVASVSIDGAEPTTFEVGPEVTSVTVEVNARSSVVFTVLTTDKDNTQAISEQYTFALGDLEVVQPATNLFHEIVSIRDADVVVVEE